MAVVIHVGDCVEVMAGMEPESVDAIVTDPPYGLEFMGKEWDRLDAGLPQENVWKGRRGQGGSSVRDDDSKPASRHHVSFGGGKAGFKRCTVCGKRAFSGTPCECDEPSWVIEYPPGAPSSVLRMQRWHEQWATAALRVARPGAYLLAFGGTRTVHRLTCALEDAGWIIRDLLVWAYAQGFPKSRSSLKPAWEPIVLARKPGPLRELAIDACRIGANGEPVQASASKGVPFGPGNYVKGDGWRKSEASGRWPANVILTDPIFDGGWEGVVGGGIVTVPATYNRQAPADSGIYGQGLGTVAVGDSMPGYGDTGTYSRFFLIPKASRADREPLVPGEQSMAPVAGAPSRSIKRCVNCGSARLGEGGVHICRPDCPDEPSLRTRTNLHPTVKSTELMRHLVRLVTPPGGTVLDPFAGSGSTLIAAEREGFDWIGIEREPEYVEIARQRLVAEQRGLGLAV